MQYPALKIILEEHAALASVLHTLRAAARPRMGDATPDFEFLRSMLFYMDEIPARQHHALEEQFCSARSANVVRHCGRFWIAWRRNMLEAKSPSRAWNAP